MPEVYFSIQLPDGGVQQCYSPSTVIRSHFQRDEILTVETFVARSRIALTEASERVRARYGYACTSALAQLSEIEELARRYEAAATIRILSL